MPSFDLVIRGGTVLDGTGADAIEADLAIHDGRIAQIGTVSGSGAEEIQAKGLLVTPGFVDIHTHYDGQVTWDRLLSPSSGHGVTSLVMGNCGVGFAPCHPAHRDMLIKVMEGVEDIPGLVMQEGISWSWESFPEYLDLLARRSYDVDIAAQVPHAPIRVHVMGKRGAAREPATAEDIGAMARLVREGVEAGALGFSTSRTMFHRLKNGNLAPTITAGEEELRGIALALAAAGKGVIEMVDDFNDTTAGFSTEFEMWRRVVAASGRPLSFALSQVFDAPDRWRQILDLVGAANRDGLPITAQVSNRPIGFLFGLDCSYHPFMACPSFRAIAALPLAGKVAALHQPELRARLLAETPDDPNKMMLGFTRDFEHLFPLGDPPDYLPPTNASLAAEALRRGVPALDLAYDCLLGDEGRALLYCPAGNYCANTPDALRAMITDRYAVQGIGDGGAHVGIICDASVPTHLLTYWTRDCPAGYRVPLAWAVQALTQAPAAHVGLGDRGVLAPGRKADLNLIDYDRLRLRAPRPVYDLPGGGRRLTQKAEGYVATVVSGVVTYREGEHTGALPGRLVRGARGQP